MKFKAGMVFSNSFYCLRVWCNERLRFHRHKYQYAMWVITVFAEVSADVFNGDTFKECKDLVLHGHKKPSACSCTFHFDFAKAGPMREVKSFKQ